MNCSYVAFIKLYISLDLKSLFFSVESNDEANFTDEILLIFPICNSYLKP